MEENITETSWTETASTRYDPRYCLAALPSSKVSELLCSDSFSLALRSKDCMERLDSRSGTCLSNDRPRGLRCWDGVLRDSSCRRRTLLRKCFERKIVLKDARKEKDTVLGVFCEPIGEGKSSPWGVELCKGAFSATGRRRLLGRSGLLRPSSAPPPAFCCRLKTKSSTQGPWLFFFS